MNKYVYLDSEYNRTNEKYLQVVCFAIRYGDKKELYWLYKNTQNIESFKRKITQLKDDGYTFISWNVEAESSAFYSLGLNPLDYKWFDLYLEYVMFSNHNNELSKGEQYVRGRVVKIPTFTNEKGPKNLVGATFKLLGVKLDSEHKDKMRDLIISCPETFTDKERKDISDYCLSDVEYLPRIMDKLQHISNRFIPREHRNSYLKEAMWRAEYAVRSTLMVRHGIPIQTEWLKNLTDSIPILIMECARDINSQFPDIKPFKWCKKDQKFKMDTKAVATWIATLPFAKKWDRTPTNKYSLAVDSFKTFFNYSHDYPRNNLGAQMLRYLNLSQQLRGFSEPAGEAKRTFWDYLGSDGMSRPYFNIYGAQSSRSQPSSTSFLFLKTGWMRSLCVPPEGYAVGAIDYSSQEFLIGALLSGDDKMLDAYKSGDVYLAYGKEIKVIPKEGTKKTHGKERDAQKPVILGWQYWSTGHGLCIILNEQIGENRYDPDSAQLLLDKLDTVYSKFARFRNRTIDDYSSKKLVRLYDGFYMFGNNPNHRSVGNMPVQGMGAAIMRKAVQLAQDAGLNIIMTLHDALYIMFKKDDLGSMDLLKKCMHDAFVFYFPADKKLDASCIRSDMKAWSLEYEPCETITKEGNKIQLQKVFIDERAKNQFNSFEKYFRQSNNLDLL
jgi:hypothetical protein